VTALCFYLGAWATEYTYLDTNNGILKTQRKTLGYLSAHLYEASHFSEFLEKRKLNTLRANWTLVTQRELGIRKFFFPQYVCHASGGICVSLNMFSQIMEDRRIGVDELSKHINKVRFLAANKSPIELKEFVSSLNASP
jgi:hypothetical protein